ncbi:MAG: phosphoadenosine phosphosulfate reductase family protein, partial [Alistipes onderdonkii]
CTYFKYYFEPYGYDKNGKPKKHTYRGKEVRAFREKFADDLLRPVFDWSAQQVIDYILDAGLEPNPLYKMGYKRVGCWPCVMANQRDILNIAQQAPERIDYIAKIEQELQCGDRLRSEFFGPDKIPAHAITSGEKYPTIHDVVRYVQWQNATGSLFDDDTATSCMSFYGLCE